MLDDLTIFFSVIFLLAGSVLLYKGMSNGDANQNGAILGGAMLLCVGSVLMWTVLKNWWEFKKYRRSRNVRHDIR